MKLDKAQNKTNQLIKETQQVYISNIFWVTVSSHLVYWVLGHLQQYANVLLYYLNFY